MKYASLLVLLASAAVAYPCVRAWFSPVSIRAVTESVKASLREGKYVASVLLLLSSVMDGILERKSSDRRAVWRFRVFSLAVLLAALSICDLMYGTLLGMKETPWASYDRTVAIVAASLDRPLSAKDSRSPEMVRVHSEYQRAVHSAQQLPWKYVYTGALICLIVFTNWFFLLMSLLLARHVVVEISAPVSWMARLGLLVVLLLGSAVLAMSCAVCVGLLTSPVLWMVLVLAKVFGSAAVLVLGLFGALIFDWLLSAPWFKALVVVSLLPSLCVLLATVGDLVDAGRKRLVAHSGRLVVVPLLERYGTRVIPLATVVVMFLAIFFVLSLLP